MGHTPWWNTCCKVCMHNDIEHFVCLFKKDVVRSRSSRNLGNVLCRLSRNTILTQVAHNGCFVYYTLRWTNFWLAASKSDWIEFSIRNHLQQRKSYWDSRFRALHTEPFLVQFASKFHENYFDYSRKLLQYPRQLRINQDSTKELVLRSTLVEWLTFVERVNFHSTHDLLLSGLVAQSVEQRTIRSGGRGFDSHWCQRFCSLPRAISYFLTRANAQWEIHGFTLAL